MVQEDAAIFTAGIIYHVCRCTVYMKNKPKSGPLVSGFIWSMRNADLCQSMPFNSSQYSINADHCLSLSINSGFFFADALIWHWEVLRGIEVFQINVWIFIGIDRHWLALGNYLCIVHNYRGLTQWKELFFDQTIIEDPCTVVIEFIQASMWPWGLHLHKA